MEVVRQGVPDAQRMLSGQQWIADVVAPQVVAEEASVCLGQWHQVRVGPIRFVLCVYLGI